MSGAISHHEAGKQRRNHFSPRGWIVLRLLVAVTLLFAAGIKAFPLESLTDQDPEAPDEATISSEIKKGENEASSNSESPSTEPSQTAPSETPPEQAPSEAETLKTVLSNIKAMEVSGPYDINKYI